MSALLARLFFALLLVGDLIWATYAASRLLFGALGALISVGKSQYFSGVQARAWLSLRRSFVCGISLIVALFSPAFGIMIACTYFVMYDKVGIEEVVPSALQPQLKEFLPKE